MGPVQAGCPTELGTSRSSGAETRRLHGRETAELIAPTPDGAQAIRARRAEHLARVEHGLMDRGVRYVRPRPDNLEQLLSRHHALPMASQMEEHLERSRLRHARKPGKSYLEKLLIQLHVSVRPQHVMSPSSVVEPRHAQRRQQGTYPARLSTARAFSATITAVAVNWTTQHCLLRHTLWIAKSARSYCKAARCARR